MKGVCSDTGSKPDTTAEALAPLFERLGIRPQGWLYAYRIPLHDVRVSVFCRPRGAQVKVFEYVSARNEWCLLNMGETAKTYPQHRLNYMSSFPAAFRPNVHVTRGAADNTDLLYCVQADTSWEDRIRAGCFLGGWDVGGKTARAKGYFTSVGDWNRFFFDTHSPSASIGPSECVVIPTAAFDCIKEIARKEYFYPRTCWLQERIREIVRDETHALLKTARIEPGVSNNALTRHTFVTLQLVKIEEDDENNSCSSPSAQTVKQRPFDFAPYADFGEQ